jgi:hypothetical protein
VEERCNQSLVAIGRESLRLFPDTRMMEEADVPPAKRFINAVLSDASRKCDIFRLHDGLSEPGSLKFFSSNAN